MDAISIAQAREHSGLRLITRQGVPTPWAQAAKGILEIKGLPYQLAQESMADEKGAQAAWLGDQGSPFVMLGDEPPRSGWASILELSERLAPSPPLIPGSSDDRIELFGIANEICGELGLGWCLRLIMIDASLREPEQLGAFPTRVADYLGKKYGYYEGCADIARGRVHEILATLSRRLGDKVYFLGDLSALDVYWATFGNMFMLLDDEDLPAVSMARDAWRYLGGGTFTDKVPDNLVTHHRRMYERHLGLPVQL
jgi:glutathione S-transferase